MRTEEKPMIARDELAARNMTALLSNPGGPIQPNPASGWGYVNCGAADVATIAVGLADALLSALAVPPAAPAPAPSPYAPKVGDVVTWGARECLYRVEDDGVLSCCDNRWTVGEKLSLFDASVSGFDLSPATASERAAAGLAEDEAKTTPAPASVEPRRTVGAVVKAPNDDIEFIVVNPGEGESCVRAITASVSVAPGFTRGSDRVVRWATLAEGELHGRDVVDRTPPAVEPRRTVGAVVRNTKDGPTFIVVEPGEGSNKQRGTWVDKNYITLPTSPTDTFDRWATKEECDRHGVPFVDRTPLAKAYNPEAVGRLLGIPPGPETPAYPVDAAGRPLWVRVTSLNGDVAHPPALTVGRVYKVTGWGRLGSPAVTTDDGCEGWFLSRTANAPDPEFKTYASWEPCAAPTDAGTPAAALTEAEREGLARELCDCCENEGGTYDGYGRNARADWLRTADAAAAWFAKRDGTVKP